MEIDPIKWNELVSAHPNATPYHLYEWGEICRAVGNEPIYLKDGGVLPLVFIKSLIFGNRLVSMPLADHGGPLSEERYTMQLLGESIKSAESKGVDYIELRDISQNQKSLYESAGFKCRQNYITFELDLNKTNTELLSVMRKNLRTEIHKLEREQELQFVELKSVNEIEDFYKLYLETMKRHGSPQLSIKFFYKMKELLELLGAVKVFFAVYEGKKVAAFVVISFNKKIYHWSSVVDNDYRILDPQTFLMWELISWARSYGYTILDLGRTRRGGNIYFAKSAWGASERDLVDAFYFFGREHKPADPEDKFYKLASRVWRVLPFFVTNFLGPKIAPKIGL